VNPTPTNWPDALHQVTDFVETALTENNQLQTKNAELQASLSQQEKVYLEKVAHARQDATQAILQEIFPGNELSTVLTKLGACHVIEPDEITGLERELRQKPSLILPLMTKLAQVATNAPSGGMGVEKLASAEDDDPDGWKAMAHGRVVRVKR
jgi:hypothetical protein